MRLIELLSTIIFILQLLPVQGFPNGAGSCKGDVAAVGGSHLADDRRIQAGPLDVGDIAVILNGVELSPDRVDTFPTNTNLDIVVRGNTVNFKGLLIRLEAPAGINTTGTIEPGDINSKIADVCIAPIVGITHVNSTDKQNMTGVINFPVGADNVILDITVVFINSVDIGSAYVYSRFLENFREGTNTAPSVSPIAISPTTGIQTVAPVASNVTNTTTAPVLPPVPVANTTTAPVLPPAPVAPVAVVPTAGNATTSPIQVPTVFVPTPTAPVIPPSPIITNVTFPPQLAPVAPPTNSTTVAPVTGPTTPSAPIATPTLPTVPTVPSPSLSLQPTSIEKDHPSFCLLCLEKGKGKSKKSKKSKKCEDDLKGKGKSKKSCKDPKSPKSKGKDKSLKGKGKRFYSKYYDDGTTKYDTTYNFFHR